MEFVDYHVEEPIIKDEKCGKNDKISKALKTLEGDAPLIQKIQYINHKNPADVLYHKEYQSNTVRADPHRHRFCLQVFDNL